MISVELYVPETGRDDYPAMVIINSSGGVSEHRERYYAKQLNANGIAALVVESFIKRGIQNTKKPDADLRLEDGGGCVRRLGLVTATPANESGTYRVKGVSKGGGSGGQYCLNMNFLVVIH